MKRLGIIAAACASLAVMSTAGPAKAQNIDNAYLGQIEWFGFNYCPRNWAPATGSLLQISSNPSLYSLLGNQYGGDGRTTFALPDLRGRVAIGMGTNSVTNTLYSIGTTGGTETQVLSPQTMPAHTHMMQLKASDQAGASDVPTGRLLGDYDPNQQTYTDPPPDVNMDASAIAVSNTGNGIAYDHRQPSLATFACIAVVGVFPQRP